MIIQNPILTGSVALNGLNLTANNLATTSSNSFTSDQSITGSLGISANTTIAGTLTVTGSIVGLATSASYVLNAVSSSKALSASYSDTASFANSFNVAGNLTASNAVLSGTLTAQTLVVSTVSSSVVYSSGSNVFGNALSNTQIFTGSVSITGSLAVNGTTAILGTGTTNYVPKFTAANIIGDSNITDSGTLITLGSDSYVNGSVGIGAAALSYVSLKVAKNITGATTSYGITSEGVIQSGVTSNEYNYISLLYTQATAFTLTNMYHYGASLGSIGAGSTVTNQTGFFVSSGMTGATNNFGFRGSLAAAANTWNLYMDGTADNFLAGNTGIGNSPNFVSAGPILTTTLTNGGSGYVDGTYTDVASSNISSNGVYALFTIIVSGSIVTTATLTWGGTTYRAGDTITVSNTLLGGTGSGLVITVDTVDSSQLYVASATGGDINLFRNDTSSVVTDNIGSIKWNGNDGSSKASGINAKLSAFAAGSSGGAYLSFFTSAGSGGALTEAVRIGNGGQVGIGGAYALTGYSLRISKNITGSTSCAGISSEGVIQSGVTTSTTYIQTSASTAAASFTIGSLRHFKALQGTIGAGSTVTSQYGFEVDSSLTGATNNYGFYGNIASGTNRWNIYMNGTANNYMAGALGIGSTNLSGYNLRVSGSMQGVTTYYGIANTMTVQPSVTSSAIFYSTSAATAASAFTLTNLFHYQAGQGAIGATSAVTNQYGFQVESNLTGATNNYGFFGNIASGTNRWNLYMAGSANNYMAGALGIGSTSLGAHNIRMTKAITGAVYAYGMMIDSSVQSDVTSGATAYSTNISTQAASFTTTLNHYQAIQSTIGAGSTVSVQAGFNAGSTLIGATTNYGFFGNIASGTNRWNLFMNGTANNYMAGSLGIGSTALTGYNLRLGANLTGATTAIGIYQGGLIQSDVVAGVYFRSNAATQATTFTLTTLQHYVANQGTFGAGSAVTNQYGYAASATLTGATNNYGFFGDIPSGTNRWNLYMAGSAANYMAGSLAIGSTNTTYSLDVNGVINTRGSSAIAGSGLSMGYLTSSYGWIQSFGSVPLVINASGNNVVIGGTSSSASAKVQIDSTTQGFLPPRGTNAQRTAITSPAVGLIFYCTDSVEGLYIYTSSGWKSLTMV